MLRDTATSRAPIEARREQMREKEKGEKCIKARKKERERRLKEEEMGSRSLLRSNMLSPHEVFSPLLPGSLTLRDLTEPFSRSVGYVPPLHRGAPSHLINVLIAVNDSEISLTRPKMENEREKIEGGEKQGTWGDTYMQGDII